ncbi:hypothetical protein DAPPUDRAFT_247516 [Daphnia pulex]|uniref:RRM domain-containing protein n=1 Tax=Daphnia pulex TaxID=6669 RepID=E9GSK7_DAPPU|nr:hypothetical protein DAPPUDRAFT_247516 [Daphnia pulex]|eukprot:EFX77447.1 hypothetical protein DAPPUDRAFT_247516 [Daphnia pulex]
MTFPFDLIATFVLWIGFTFISHCTEITRSQLTETVNLTCVEPDDLGTRKGTLNTTRQTTASNNNNFRENNNNLIKKLAEKSNIAAENKNLKLELAKLQFELALSENNNRKLEKALDELAASQSAMEAKALFLEQENIRLIEEESKSTRIIEHKDRVLEVISVLSSGDNLNDNNLIGIDEKTTEVLRLLAENTETTIIQVTPDDVGCEQSNMQPSNDLAICAPNEVFFQWTSSSDTNLKPLVASEYLILTNLPLSLHGEDYVHSFELHIGKVAQYIMFTDDQGQYIGNMAVFFVHPSDTRRAYKTYDGMLSEGNRIEVSYFINGQRSYQKEEEPVPTISLTPVEVSQSTDVTSADELFQQTASDSVDDVISPPVASPSFVDNEKAADEYILLSNLPPFINVADIVERLQLIIGEVAHYTMFADDTGQYAGSMAVAFVHPSDARRAYKTCDGSLYFLVNMNLWHKVEVTYYINGQRSYQKEEGPVPTATDGVFVADLINASPTIDIAPIVPEALAVHQQETLPGATTEEIHHTTHLDDLVVDKDLVEDSLSCETNPILMTRKQKINKRTARRKKAKKNRDAAAASSSAE